MTRVCLQPKMSCTERAGSFCPTGDACYERCAQWLMVEVVQLKIAATAITKAMSQSHELEDTLKAQVTALEKENKCLKAKADFGELCPNCGERAVHLTLYDDRVCSACNHSWLAEDLDDEPPESSESSEDWLDNASF